MLAPGLLEVLQRGPTIYMRMRHLNSCTYDHVAHAHDSLDQFSIGYESSRAAYI